MSLSKRFIIFAVMAGAFAQSSLAFFPMPGSKPKTEIKRECFNQSSIKLGRSVKYCLHSLPGTPANSPIVYFLPSSEDGADDFVRLGYGTYLQGRSHLLGIWPPFVVSVSPGKSTWYTDWPAAISPEANFESWLVQEFVPFFEGKHQMRRPRSKRFLAGHGMGGFGAIKIAIRHPRTFSVAAANSPQLPIRNPFDSDQLWQDHFRRYNIDAEKGTQLLTQLRTVFVNRQNFELHDPTIASLDFKESPYLFPKIYFDIGGRDEWGTRDTAFRLETAFRLRHRNYNFIFDPDANQSGRPDLRVQLIDYLIEAGLHTAEEDVEAKPNNPAP